MAVLSYDNFDYSFEAEWNGERVQRYGLKPVRTVAPAAQPVTLAELKEHCRVLHNEDDDQLSAYLEAAIETVDGYSGTLGRALINQTWRLNLREFGGIIRLPLEPVSSVTSITYYDSDNALQTLSTDIYEAFTDARGYAVCLKHGQSWPSTYARPDAVAVTFVAGYGETSASVPERIRAAIKLHAAFLYQIRETDTTERHTPTGAYERLLRPLSRVY